MLRPELLPDEMVGSYLGALWRLNGVGGECPAAQVARTRSLIDGWTSQRGDPGDSTSLERIAEVAGVDAARLRQHHTLGVMVPTIRPTSRRPRLGTPKFSFASESVKPEFCFCSDCVASDLDTFGRSYWRREHQLPGIYWCPKHKRPLRVARVNHAYLVAPSTLLGQSEEFDYDWVKTLWTHKFICRYLDMLYAFLDAGEPISAPVIRDALRLIAKPRGYQTRPNEGKVANSTRSILSQEASELFPSEWLQRTFASFKPSTGPTLQIWLDGTLWMPIAPTNAAGYALAASMLFPSGDVLIQAMCRAQALAGEASPGPSSSNSQEGKQEKGTDVQARLAAARLVNGRRRILTVQEKAALVQRTYEPGMSVALVAQEEGLVGRRLYRWRKLEENGALQGAPAELAVDSPELAAARAENARLRHSIDVLTLENATLRAAIELTAAKS